MGLHPKKNIENVEESKKNEYFCCSKQWEALPVLVKQKPFVSILSEQNPIIKH